MARVNHKLVKQRMNEKFSKITDRQFFTSRLLAGHFEDIAAAQTRRYNYNRRVHVLLSWNPKELDVASTDNSEIKINCGSKIVTKNRGRENRYWIVCGLFAHELGHVLYTDFLASQTYLNYMERGQWYPEVPVCRNSKEVKNEIEFWDYIKADPQNMQLMLHLAHTMANIIEDGYIENRMLVNFPGTLGYGMEAWRDVHFDFIPTVTQLIEREESGEGHIFDSITQNILSYAKFGEIKYGEEPLTNERIATVFDLIGEIDKALLAQSAKERLAVVNTILIRCWDYVRDYLEKMKELQANAAASGASEDAVSIMIKRLGSLAGSSSIAEGDTMPVTVSSSEPAETVSATSAARAKTKADSESESDENLVDDAASAEGDASAGTEEGESGETDESATENADAGTEPIENPIEMAADMSSVNPGGKQKASSNEKGRLPKVQTGSVSNPVGGSIETDNDYKREIYADAASDIERILERMAEKAACEELENERLKELNDVAQSISYGDVHSGVDIRVKRIQSVDDDLIDQYNIIAPQLLNISRQLQRSLLRQLKEERRGGKMTGLLFGRRLDSHALHRNDGKVFYKNSLPKEIPELSVGLLLDESGSMSSCDRCTYARAAAIILYDFCESLNIPIMVYGHSTSGSAVNLFSYAEFDGFDKNDKYRLMDISSRESNRDGAALRFVAEQLSKRPESVKILILVSDGQPAAMGYYGTAAEEDLRGIKQEYKRKGLLFVAAAIGDDKEDIERIYGDSFLDITDLNQLPTKLTSVVKRHVRV